jgi:two-component system response regulator
MENTVVEILLVEDNPSDAEITIRALKKNNIANNIIHLCDGVEAVEFLFGTGAFKDRDISRLPKLILLDLKMPRMDGMEVLAKIKGNEQTVQIPVVVLTSSNEDPDIQRCYKLGVNSYIVKPVGFDNFNKIVAELGFYWMLLNKLPN